MKFSHVLQHSEPLKPYAEWNKLDTKVQMIYGSSYIKSVGKFIETGSS